MLYKLHMCASPRGARLHEAATHARARRARGRLQELVEHTLPWAAAALTSWHCTYRVGEGQGSQTYDAAAYARLFCIAVRGRVLRHRRDLHHPVMISTQVLSGEKARIDYEKRTNVGTHQVSLGRSRCPRRSGPTSCSARPSSAL